MTTQKMYDEGLRCRSRGFCFLCKEDTNGCVEYINTEVKEKPPLGVTPKYIWDEQKLSELQEIITRYCNHNLEIPVEWIEEYNDLIKLCKKDGE